MALVDMAMVISAELLVTCVGFLVAGAVPLVTCAAVLVAGAGPLVTHAAVLVDGAVPLVTGTVLLVACAPPWSLVHPAAPCDMPSLLSWPKSLPLSSRMARTALRSSLSAWRLADCALEVCGQEDEVLALGTVICRGSGRMRRRSSSSMAESMRKEGRLGTF